MQNFRNRSIHTSRALVASFEACVSLAVKGQAHPALAHYVSQRNAHGWTLLTMVSDRLSPQGVKIVLAAGADPLARNKNGQTARETLDANPLALSEPNYGDLMERRAEVIALLMHAENLAAHRLKGGTLARMAASEESAPSTTQETRRPARMSA